MHFYYRNYSCIKLINVLYISLTSSTEIPANADFFEF